MKTITVIGGRNYKGQELNKDVHVIHHTGHIKRKNRKQVFEKLIKNADCIILFPDACSHQNMYDVRGLSKQYKKQIIYPKGLSLKEAISKAYNTLEKRKQSV